MSNWRHERRRSYSDQYENTYRPDYSPNDRSRTQLRHEPSERSIPTSPRRRSPNTRWTNASPRSGNGQAREDSIKDANAGQLGNLNSPISPAGRLPNGVNMALSSNNTQPNDTAMAIGPTKQTTNISHDVSISDSTTSAMFQGSKSLAVNSVSSHPSSSQVSVPMDIDEQPSGAIITAATRQPECLPINQVEQQQDITPRPTRTVPLAPSVMMAANVPLSKDPRLSKVVTLSAQSLSSKDSIPFKVVTSPVQSPLSNSGINFPDVSAVNSPQHSESRTRPAQPESRSTNDDLESQSTMSLAIELDKLKTIRKNHKREADALYHQSRKLKKWHDAHQVAIEAVKDDDVQITKYEEALTRREQKNREESKTSSTILKEMARLIHEHAETIQTKDRDYAELLTRLEVLENKQQAQQTPQLHPEFLARLERLEKHAMLENNITKDAFQQSQQVADQRFQAMHATIDSWKPLQPEERDQKVSTRMSKLETDMHGLVTRLNKLSDNASSNTTQIKDMSTKLVTLPQDLETLKSSLETIVKKASDNAQHSYNTLDNKLGNDLRMLCERIKDVKQDWQNHATMIDGVQKQLGGVDEVTRSLQTQWQNDLQHVENATNQETQRIDKKQAGLQTLLQDLEAKTTDMHTRLQISLQSLESGSTDMQATVAGVQARSNETTEAIRELCFKRDVISTANAQIKTLQDQQATTSTKFEHVTTRLEVLENHVKQTQEAHKTVRNKIEQMQAKTAKSNPRSQDLDGSSFIGAASRHSPASEISTLQLRNGSPATDTAINALDSRLSAFETHLSSLRQRFDDLTVDKYLKSIISVVRQLYPAPDQMVQRVIALEQNLNKLVIETRAHLQSISEALTHKATSTDLTETNNNLMTLRLDFAALEETTMDIKYKIGPEGTADIARDVITQLKESRELMKELVAVARGGEIVDAKLESFGESMTSLRKEMKTLEEAYKKFTSEHTMILEEAKRNHDEKLEDCNAKTQAALDAADSTTSDLVTRMARVEKFYKKTVQNINNPLATAPSKSSVSSPTSSLFTFTNNGNLRTTVSQSTELSAGLGNPPLKKKKKRKLEETEA